MDMPIDAAPAVELRRSAGDRYAILVMEAVILLGAVALLGGALAVAGRSPGAASFLLLMGVFVAGLAALVGQEALVRWRTRITLVGDRLRLRLPGRRGYVAQAPLDRELPLSAIEGVDTRLEAFRSAGTTTLQRSYSLALRDGSRIVLGGDRRLLDPFYAGVAETVAVRAGVPLRDLGTVDGEPGFLMLWGQSVPP
jgi:hypothetical protein